MHDRRDEDKIFVWDILLAEEAATIVAAGLIDHWNDALGSLYSHIAGTKASFVVRITVESPPYYLQTSLVDGIEAPLRPRLCSWHDESWAHRDDFEFFWTMYHLSQPRRGGEIPQPVLALKADELAQLRQYHSIGTALAARRCVFGARRHPAETICGACG